MNKIKISELPVSTSLIGLFTIGTDNQNRSVKVSLEFVETAINNADDATLAANNAAEAATTAKENADDATTAANNAAEAATTAKETTLLTIRNLVPTGLTVDCISRITTGNVNPIQIKAVLSPATALRNLIYISDNRAVTVSTDGHVTATAKGRSIVHVIPTCNTSLAQTLLIEVGDPTLRYNTRTQLRFTQAGGLRLI